MTNTQSNVIRSHVVLLARVDDPVKAVTLTTRTTIVPVEHYADDPLPKVVEMALELAPDVKEWSQY